MKRILLTAVLAAWRWEALANPTGLTVVSGTASAHSSGSHLNVTAGNGAVIQWGSFNIGKGQTTQFIQPSANSIVLNTIGGNAPSQIWGHLIANGTVLLANAYGFYFGPNSMIKVGGNFVATTAPLPPDLGIGSSWQFTVPPPAASIVNYGEMQVGEGRSLFLISENIENHGALSAPGGNVGLYAGQEVDVSERADGRGLSAKVELPAGSIDNTGAIVTTPGELALDAEVVNKQDVTAAATAQVNNGEVDLVAADITLGSSPSGGAQNVNTAFQGASSITLQASDSITLNANTTWNLSASTGFNSGQLTLSAGNNIVLNNNSQIVDANNWSLSLQAGNNISLSGNSVIQSGAGSIAMTAGDNITVGSGAIRTTGGGGINLTATTGDINAGTKNDGYIFSIAGYAPSATLGQIATAAGGNVTLTAGDDVTSAPTVPNGQAPGASGAYGPEPGNVTVTAGNQVLGNFTVANGVGTINATDVGSSTRPVALSLIDGSWNVKASDDVVLSEIRNPNGAFNAANLPVPSGEYIGNLEGPVPGRSSFLFDYTDDASASITAGNSITLTGANLPRLSQDQQMPPIYPPILFLDAGAGGVTLDNSIILFPSTLGGLTINTTHGGDLSGQTQQSTLTGIIMSDSGLPGWSTFAQGHAITPLHLHDPNPVVLDVSGSIDSFGLTVPTFADVTVSGDTYNFGFQGQNLLPSETTEIAVAGSITYRGDLTSVSLAQALPASLYNLSLSGDPNAAKKISYDAQTQTLTFIGQMSAADEAFLLNPFEVVNGRDVSIPLTSQQQAAIQQLFNASQSASLGDQGLALTGSGNFDISASSLDLGISGGISVGIPDAALAAISKQGADLTVDVTGDLQMTASKIANSSYLGAINLNVGGTLNVGGELSLFGDPNSPKGIFTTSGGNVLATVGGDVNVNGSRIAAYDGGNIVVDSLDGSINAGSGASGYVGLQSLYLNRQGNLVSVAATIPGSGILATTVPGSPAPAGNISIDVPNGSLVAGAGGVILIPYNGSSLGGALTINADTGVNSRGSGIINLGEGATEISAANVYGLIVTRGKAKITAQGNINATVFAGLGASLSAGGNVSGTVISGGAVDVSGDSITAALEGESVSAAGNTADAAIGLPAANTPADNVKTTDDPSTSLARTTDDSTDDDTKKKKKVITLAKKSSRVTVLLPPRK